MRHTSIELIGHIAIFCSYPAPESRHPCQRGSCFPCLCVHNTPFVSSQGGVLPIICANAGSLHWWAVPTLRDYSFSSGIGGFRDMRRILSGYRVKILPYNSLSTQQLSLILSIPTQYQGAPLDFIICIPCNNTAHGYSNPSNGKSIFTRPANN